MTPYLHVAWYVDGNPFWCGDHFNQFSGGGGVTKTHQSIL